MVIYDSPTLRNEGTPVDSSEKEDSSYVAALGLSAMLILVGVFVWQIPALKGESGAWASWVQAFGSVGAIIGTYFAGLSQAKRELANERRQARASNGMRESIQNDYVSMVRDLVRWIPDVSRGPASQPETPDDRSALLTIVERWKAGEGDQIDAVLNELRTMPLYEITAGRRRRSFLYCRSGLERLVRHVSELPPDIDWTADASRSDVALISNTANNVVMWCDAFLQKND